MKKFLEKNYRLLVGAILAFVLIVSLLNAWNDSAIFDETAHIPAAYSYLKFHDMRLNPEHPPLIKDLSAIPLLFLNLNFDTSENYWTEDVNGQWDAGKKFLFHSGNDADRLIFWARVPIVLLSLVLGLFILKWTREMAGKMASLFAFVLFAFDPNILGHNHFVTTDIGIAAFLVFAFYYFIRFIKYPTGKNILLAALFLGLLQLAKFSAVLAFPIFFLMIILYPLVRFNPEKNESDWRFRIKSLGEYILKGAAVFGISLMVVWGVYAFNAYKMPREKLTETIDYYFPADDPAPYIQKASRALNAVNRNEALKPLSEYFLGVAMVFKRVAGGNGVYYLEQVSGKAFLSYFPVVFLIKEPLFILAFLLAALLISLAKTVRTFFFSLGKSLTEPMKTAIRYVRTNPENFFLFLFVIFYSFASITGNLNIGFRHLFPVLPFAYILAAAFLFHFAKKLKNQTGCVVFNSALFFFSVFLIVETAAAYPDYMSYFNPIAGGPKNGYRYVTDSNADWGQDLKRLKSFLEERPYIQKIRVDYFGGADIRYYIGEKYRMWWDGKRPIESGWYAVSVNFLQGSVYDRTKKDSESYRWIADIPFRYQVGTSILVYYISPETAAQKNGW